MQEPVWVYPWPKARYGTGQAVLVLENLPASAGVVRDVGLTPGSGRSLRGGNGSPFQYSCLENPMDTGAWRATVHRVAESWTWPMRHSTYTHSLLCNYDCQGLKLVSYCPGMDHQIIWKLRNYHVVASFSFFDKKIYISPNILEDQIFEILQPRKGDK